MAEYRDLVQTLTWLLTNRVQQKIQYTHGLLGDGNGRVRVSTTPGSPEVDYVYVRPDRFSDRVFKVFNKRLEGQDGDPVIIGELPWEPDLIQVVDMDWAAYADVGWGDDITTTNRHGISHQWRDGAPGIDTFNVYRRQFGDLKTYPAVSGTVAVGVSPYSLDIYGTQYQWPGIQAFSLIGAIPAGTGTARMALVYWSPVSGTTGYLGVATGTLGSAAEATILNRPVTPEGAIPSAFVRLKGGQSSITEFDIWDAREPFRPGILFGTGSAAALNAGLIPIVDNSGLYTGSTVEAALEQLGYDAARVSKIYESDFGAVAMEADAVGNITINGTGTLTIPTDLIHAGDPDTKFSFTPDVQIYTVGGVVMLRLTNTTQDLVEIGDVAGGGDVDVKINGSDLFIRGSDGSVAINTVTPDLTVQGTAVNANLYIEQTDSPTTRGANLVRQSDTAARGPRFEFARSRASLATTVNGDAIADITCLAHDGTDFNHSASIHVELDGAVSANTTPMTITMLTSTTNSGGLTERIRITSAGRIGIGNVTSPLAQTHIDQASTTVNIPVLYLDQGDVSEEVIWIRGTSSASTADQSLVDSGDFTTPGALLGWVKGKIDDTRAGGLGTIDVWYPFYAIPTA